jgi:hypothetical protein
MDVNAPFNNYIILDDETDMLGEQNEHFYQTDWNFGLTEKDVKNIIKMINTNKRKLNE